MPVFGSRIRRAGATFSRYSRPVLNTRDCPPSFSLRPSSSEPIGRRIRTKCPSFCVCGPGDHPDWRDILPFASPSGDVYSVSRKAATKKFSSHMARGRRPHRRGVISFGARPLEFTRIWGSFGHWHVHKKPIIASAQASDHNFSSCTRNRTPDHDRSAQPGPLVP